MLTLLLFCIAFVLFALALFDVHPKCTAAAFCSLAAAFVSIYWKA